MEKLKVLFTSSGRRVELIELFKQENWYTVAADCDATAPTLFKADKRFEVPRVVREPDRYIEKIKDIIETEKIDIVIPLIDPELSLLAQEKEKRLKSSTMILISNKEMVDIAFDKYKTYQFFKKIGLPTPRTYLLEDALQLGKDETQQLFPALLKPRCGSAGIGLYDCEDMDYVIFLNEKGKLENYILQEKVQGVEITTDIFGNGSGKMIAAVQRKRLKIRGGEVERGVTVKYNLLFGYAQQFTEQFCPMGPVNIQCFYDKEQEKVSYIEINPRFGGGYPLAYHAGVNAPVIIKHLLTGSHIPETANYYREGLLMSRYDSAVYVTP
jgi:carbamoyl-phosphate synthase large subunit